MFSQLSPNPEDVLKAEVTLGPALPEAEQQASFDVRRCMNVMKTVGEALRKAQSTSDEGGAERFNLIMNEASRVSRALLLRWGKSPEDRANKWMLNVIEKSIMPYVSEKPLSEDMLDELSRQLENLSFDWPENNAYQDEASIDLALFRGLSRLSKEYDEYSFYRKNKDDDLAVLRDAVIAQSLQVMDDLCPALADRPSRIVFLTMIMGEMFDVMVLSWRRNAVRARAALEGKTQPQIKAWRSANPEGFGLDPILEGFAQNAGRVTRLTASVRKTPKKS